MLLIETVELVFTSVIGQLFLKLRYCYAPWKICSQFFSNLKSICNSLLYKFYVIAMKNERKVFPMYVNLGEIRCAQLSMSEKVP